MLGCRSARVSGFYAFQRTISRFVAATSVVHLPLIVSGFVVLRLFVALRDGVELAGDNASGMGADLGRFWVGELTWNDLLNTGYSGSFLRQRSSQLLYPLLLSLHRPLGVDLSTQVLLVNTLLGGVLIAASYAVGRRLCGKTCAVLVALLMCSITGLYWIGRFAIVDNVFYAMIPLAALSVLNWDRRATRMSIVLMCVAFAALVLTRPESAFVVLSLAVVVIWCRVRRSWSRVATLAALGAVFAAAAVAAVAVVSYSPSVRATLFTRAHVAWGLAGSAHTLLNRNSVEFDALLAHYTSGRYPDVDEMHYRMSMDAIETIRANPAWYVTKVPLRGLALIFPWTYRPWSIPHVAYEALYTLFVVTGLILLLRRGRLGLSVALLVAMPVAIWLFLSAYLIDNDLKHRNGLLVALNLVAPLGYFDRRRAGDE